MSFPTLTERKRAKVDGMVDAVETLSRELAAYARKHGGRYVLFGSAARGELQFDSDVDIVTDFSREEAQAAWDFAEDRAYALGLKPDIHMLGWLGDRLRQRIAVEGRSLS